MADKVQCKELGAAFVALIAAIGDGVDPSDAGALISLVTAASAAADDIKSDVDAAVSYAIAGAAESFGDLRAS